jgi:hypothetical protein
MPNKWLKCAACGLVFWGSLHGFHQCERGWCKPETVHHDDLPERHFSTTPPSTGQQQVQLDTGARST